MKRLNVTALTLRTSMQSLAGVLLFTMVGAAQVSDAQSAGRAGGVSNPRVIDSSRGFALTLDLVALATALTETSGRVEFLEHEVKRLSAGVRARVESYEILLETQIALRVARQQAKLYAKITRQALESAQDALEVRRKQYEMIRVRYRAGQADQAEVLGTERLVAEAEGQVLVLREIATVASGAGDSKDHKDIKDHKDGKDGEKDASAGPRGLRLHVYADGKYGLETDARGDDAIRQATEKDVLATLDATPRKERADKKLTILVGADVETRVVARLMEQLGERGFVRIELKIDPAKRAAPERR